MLTVQNTINSALCSHFMFINFFTNLVTHMVCLYHCILCTDLYINVNGGALVFINYDEIVYYSEQEENGRKIEHVCSAGVGVT